MNSFRNYVLLFLIFLPSFIVAQGVHSLRAELDVPMLGLGGISFAYSMEVLLDVPPLTEEQIRQMDPFRVNGLDRVATKQLSGWAHRASNTTLHTSFATPFALMLDGNSRSEAGTVGLMFLEMAFINNALTNIFKGVTKRTRPFVYNNDALLPIKTTKNARHSFFSGHASNSASYTFFAAKVFTDNNPHSDWNPFIWTAAVTLPAATSFFRVKAGKHFPTDVIVGYAVGAAVGFLIPHLHK